MCASLRASAFALNFQFVVGWERAHRLSELVLITFCLDLCISCAYSLQLGSENALRRLNADCRFVKWRDIGSICVGLGTDDLLI